MIRIRRTLERAQRHRWLWILVLVLLAILVALLALHSAGDAGVVDGPLVCMAVVLLVAAVLAVPRPRPLVVVRPARSRAPPRPLPSWRPPRPASPHLALPLRL